MSDTRKRKTYPVKPEKGWALAWATDNSGRPGTGYLLGWPVYPDRRSAWVGWIRTMVGDEAADRAMRNDGREVYAEHKRRLYRMGCRVIRVEVRPLEEVRL